MTRPRSGVPLGSRAARSSTTCQRAAEHVDQLVRGVGSDERAPHGFGDEPGGPRLDHPDRHLSAYRVERYPTDATTSTPIDTSTAAPTKNLLRCTRA